MDFTAGLASVDLNSVPNQSLDLSIGHPIDDEKDRLVNFVNQLRDASEAKGYTIFYGGRWDLQPSASPPT